MSARTTDAKVGLCACGCGLRTSVADGYNARENARAERMRNCVRACEHCGGPIFEDPGHCVQCAWDGPEAVRR